MVDDPVKRVDNMAMALSLEMRVPFLDHEVVELAARIPADLKVAGGGKTFSKRPRAGWSRRGDRPAEGLFPVPALKYFRGAFLDFVRGVLERPSAAARSSTGLISIACLPIRNTDLRPKGHSKLWQVALLECWLQTQGI